MDLSLPFYDEDIKLGPKGGGWLRDNVTDNAFHAGTDFNTSPTAVFDVCAAAGGVVHGSAGGRIVLSHTSSDGSEFRTVYVHVDPDTLTKGVGDAVTRGELLGRTDGAEDPIHLHFGVAARGPAFRLGGVDVPALWYFLDPWGVYDLRADHYLPTSGRIFEAPIVGADHTVQWRAQPVFKAIPIARTTADYRGIVRVQVRVRRGANEGGTFPAEHEQFLFWLKDDPDFFLVPLTQATDRKMEIELVALLREAAIHQKPVRVEYRYAGDDRYVMAAWMRAG